ncbi:MAG: ATP-binding response regulator, partial [Gemmatimonadales bacterium]
METDVLWTVGVPALVVGVLLGVLAAWRRRPAAPPSPPRPSGPVRSPDAAPRRELSAFEAGLANVINLLNNRLSAIMGFAALVNREQLEAQDQEALDVVRAEARQAAEISRDLIHLVQQPAPATDATHLATAVDDALRREQPDLAERGATVTRELDPSVTRVAGRQVEVVSLLVRLLKFALARLKQAPEPRRVVWSTRAMGASIIFTQVDSGPLVEAELVRGPLDPYRPTDARLPGYGELALAQRVAENLGGSLRVDAGAAGGAHVTVTLLPGSVAEVPLPHATPGATPIPRGRILVVEDDPANQKALAQLLEKEGHHVTVASNGVEAYSHIERAEFDAVVCDLQMPLLGGRGLYEQTLEQFPQVARRFVFVTGDDVRA